MPRLTFFLVMQHPLSLPALGALLVAAAAFGVHLGESAIAEIDPVHFSGPAIHPRDRGAAVDPNEVDPAGPYHASLYGWDEGAEARAAECGDCAVLPARNVYAFEPDAAEAAEIAIERAERWAEGALEEARHELERIEERADWVEVERYAYYPITVEEAEARGSEMDYPDPAGGL